MEDLSVIQAILALLLLLMAVGFSGYLAGSAGFYVASLLRRKIPARMRLILWVNFTVASLAIGYYSNVFLPILLISAYSAWCYHISLRIRREKTYALLKELARYRSIIASRNTMSAAPDMHSTIAQG